MFFVFPEARAVFAQLSAGLGFLGSQGIFKFDDGIAVVGINMAAFSPSAYIYTHKLFDSGRQFRRRTAAREEPLDKGYKTMRFCGFIRERLDVLGIFLQSGKRRCVQSRHDLTNLHVETEGLSHILKTLERLPHHGFQHPDFLVGQLLELTRSPPFRQSSLVLPYEHKQIFRHAVRHLDRLHDAPQRFIMTAQIVNLVRQVLFNRPQDACVKKLRRFRTVKIPVQIGSIVQHLDISFRRWPPLDEIHQRP